MLSQEADILILGGGLSGLAAAHYLGGQCIVVEAEPTPGGLCRSFEKDGFVYDIGGHILFSKNEEILKEILFWLGSNVEQKYRRNQIWYRDRYVKYPFENGLGVLDKEEIYDCLMGYLDRQSKKPTNLLEWCYHRFGSGIAEKYLIPYNQKIWKYDLKRMSTHWVDRIPSPPLGDIIKSAVGIETEGYTHQLHFYYPKQGGIQSLIKSLAKSIPRIKTGFRVKNVVKNKDTWTVLDGRSACHSRQLISTIPLPDLIAALEGVPDDLKKTVKLLKYNSLILVMVAVKHEGLLKRTALYIPDPKILPHRVCFMKYFSSSNAPAGSSHLVAEITVPPSSECLTTSPDLLIDKVISDISGICEFSVNDLVATDLKIVKYAYVIYDSRYAKNMQLIYDYLKSNGIHPLGRFGSFQYLNMDQCVEEAKRLAQSLTKTIPSGLN